MSNPQLNFALNVSGSVGGTSPETGASVGEQVSISAFLQLLSGTGAGQGDTVFQGARTISASATDVLDLNGVLTDVFGAVCNFLHVKAIVIIAAATNTGDIQVGPNTSNPFAGPWMGTAPLQAISPGEFTILTKGSASAAGWPVVAATGDLMRVVNTAAATAGYTVIIVGTSA